MRQRQEKTKQVNKLTQNQLRKAAANIIARSAVLVAYFRNRKQAGMPN